jgi:hypothetical protein
MHALTTPSPTETLEQRYYAVTYYSRLLSLWSAAGGALCLTKATLSQPFPRACNVMTCVLHTYDEYLAYLPAKDTKFLASSSYETLPKASEHCLGLAVYRQYVVPHSYRIASCTTVSNNAASQLCCLDGVLSRRQQWVRA